MSSLAVASTDPVGTGKEGSDLTRRLSASDRLDVRGISLTVLSLACA
jgi:hypothetical protein